MDEFTLLENEYWHNLAVKIPRLHEEIKSVLNVPMMRGTLGVFLAKLDNSPEAKKLFDELEGLYVRQLEIRKRLTELERLGQNS